MNIVCPPSKSGHAYVQHLYQRNIVPRPVVEITGSPLLLVLHQTAQPDALTKSEIVSLSSNHQMRPAKANTSSHCKKQDMHHQPQSVQPTTGKEQGQTGNCTSDTN